MEITTLNNENEALIDFYDVSIFQEMLKNHTLEFSIVKTERNKYVYDMVKEENVVNIEDDYFRIKIVEENPYTKTAYATSTFFDTIDDYVEQTFPDGLYSISEALDLAFSESDWSYRLEGNYPQRAKLEQFGNDNTLSMFNKVLNAFNSEYVADTKNNVVTIKRSIGIDTDYQITYKNNLMTINRNVDSGSIKTAIKVFYNLDEFGNYNSSITYLSPNKDKYPKLKWAMPVFSDVITTASQATSTARLVLNDEPTINVEVEFVALQQAGYNSNEIQLGNRLFLIDERMDIDATARITALKTFPYEPNRTPLVTISSIKKSMSNLAISQVKNQAIIEQSAVKLQSIYNGCMISKEEGFTTTAMNGVKTYQNSTEGIRITVDGENQFFVDPINRQLTLDGRLLITANQNPLFDGFLDENGGILRIYDVDNNLNVEIGSNRFSQDKNGGALRIYDDFGQGRDAERIDLSIERDNKSGRIALSNSATNLPKVLITANVLPQSMFILADNNDEPRTFIGTEQGFIDKSVIITAATLQPILDTINDNLQSLQDQINDLS